MSFWSWAISQIMHNEMLIGLAGGGLVTTIAYSLKAVPGKLYALLERLLTVKMTIYNDDEIYRMLDQLFSVTRKATKSTDLGMTDTYDHELERWNWDYTLGVGWHIVRDCGHFYLVNKDVQEAAGLAAALGPKRSFSFTIYTLGRSQKAIRSLMGQAKDVYENKSTIGVYMWMDGNFHLVNRRRGRDLDTIFMPEEQKQRILADLHKFINSKEIYEKRGTPYIRGWGFEGGPGTGKTTLISALCAQVGRDVYVIAPNSVGGDNGMLAAMNAIPIDGAAVIEDIDSCTILHDRDMIAMQKEKNPLLEAKLEPDKALTLSGLLNAIDGIGTRTGRLLFITSNHMDKLDAALLRPGRIDVRERIGPLTAYDARRMFDLYLPGVEHAPLFDAHIAPHLPIPAAELQGKLINLTS